MSHISYSELKEWTTCAWKHKLNYVDKIKQLDLELETKEILCNSEIRKVLIKNKIVPSYEIKDWLQERREEYLDLMAYVKRDNEWKIKHNIATE